MGEKKCYLNRKQVEEAFADCGLEDLSGVVRELEDEVRALIRRRHAALLPRRDEAYEQGEPFLTAYPAYDVASLPSWVRERIGEARVTGKTKRTVLLPDGRKYQLNNPLNHLSGAEWTYFINSVVNTAYKTAGPESYAHSIRKIHPTPKPPQLMRDIIAFFTKEGELVFDYFMGVGGTLLGAGLCGRRAAGVELNETYLDAYRAAAREIGVPAFAARLGDCMEVLSDAETMHALTDGDEISLVLIDPPYGNMMSREKTGADIKVYGNVATPFTDSDKDFGNLGLESFFAQLRRSVELVLPYVKTRGHVVVFIKDLQPDGKQANLLHARIVDELNGIDALQYKGLKIWADQTAKLYPYGYPFAFVANQIHQYILVFRKEKP